MGYYLPGYLDPTKIFHLILGTLLIGGAHVLNQWFEREQDARQRVELVSVPSQQGGQRKGLSY